MTNTGTATDWTTFNADTGEIRPVTIAELYDTAALIDEFTGFVRVSNCDCYRCAPETTS